jgi:hypothetical protein
MNTLFYKNKSGLNGDLRWTERLEGEWKTCVFMTVYADMSSLAGIIIHTRTQTMKLVYEWGEWVINDDISYFDG